MGYSLFPETEVLTKDQWRIYEIIGEDLYTKTPSVTEPKAGLSNPIRITQFMLTEVVTIQLVWRLALHEVFEMVLR